MDASIILGLSGLFLGRFLNLTIDRLPPHQAPSPGLLPGAGRHPSLLVTLAPLVGGLWAGGEAAPVIRARGRYVSVEVIAALAYGFIGYRYGLTPAAAVLMVYCALFIHLAFVDLEHSLILNKVVLPALPLAIALFPFSPLGQDWGLGEAYLRSLSGAGLGFGIMLLVYIASRGGTGAGDVKLAALLGAMLGFPQIAFGLPMGFVVGGLAALAALALRVKGRKEAIPFGPALIIGATLILLGGPGVYQWYLGLFR